MSQRFVASARFRVPEPPPAVVERQRLIEPFTSASAPVTLVIGSPGAGKSAVLTAWVAERSGPTAWLSCDPTDVDPVRFWAALAMAIDRCVDGAPSVPVGRLGSLPRVSGVGGARTVRHSSTALGSTEAWLAPNSRSQARAVSSAVRRATPDDHISVNTLKSHVKAIYRKLDASSRDEAVERACQLGLL